jgi:hypothetical protein
MGQRRRKLEGELGRRVIIRSLRGMGTERNACIRVLLVQAVAELSIWFLPEHM